MEARPVFSDSQFVYKSVPPGMTCKQKINREILRVFGNKHVTKITLKYLQTVNNCD